MLLDVPVSSPLEADVIAALLARAAASLVTLPAEDYETHAALVALGLVIEPVADDRPAAALTRLGRYLFSSDTPPQAAA